MTASKIVAAAASGAGSSDPVDVTEVFSTFVYAGTGSAQTITNDIDLNGEGGLVWTKRRDHAGNGHMLVDTVRGGNSFIKSNSSDAVNTSYTLINSFNNNGYTLSTNGWVNGSGDSVCSWTFRKQRKFFDIVTWSGNGVNGRTINHSLGSVPGMILVKRLDSADGWITYHRGMDASAPEDYAMFLNLTNARATETYWNNTAPTSTGFTVSSNVKLNGSSGNYIAYLFAHNNSDGGFGPDQDQDIIKCGSYTNSGSGVTVDLGFEPQWLLVKRRDGTGNWCLVDVMRGVNLVTAAGDNSRQLRPNLDYAENNEYNPFPYYSGFKVEGTAGGGGGGSNTYIYVAIRRGPLNIPTDATKFFMPYYTGSSNLPGLTTTNFPADFFINTQTSGAPRYSANRLTAGGSNINGKYMIISSNSNANGGGSVEWFNNEKASTSIDFYTSWYGASGVVLGHIWRRAPNYFDVSHYYGNGGGQSVYHNLGVAPEMVWIKRRDSNGDWGMYFNSGSGTECAVKLNSTDDMTTSSISFTRQAHRVVVYNTGFPVDISINNADYIAYFFVTCPGVSKCGTYTGSGSTQNIDCGFSNGARYVMIRQRTSGGSTSQRGTFVFDTARGIVSGNDNYLRLNDVSADTTDQDWIDPHSSGFTVSSAGGNDLNQSGRTYIFYAVA